MRSALLAGLASLTAACTPLSAFNALVPQDHAATRVVHDARFAEGARGTLDLYAPKTAGKSLPVIVFFYGGSWNSGSKAGYAFVGRALAAQGFVVAIPDYRILPDAQYPQFLEDGAAAVRWVRANAGRFGGDGEALVLAGHSAGAYNAAMLALDPRWLGPDRAVIRGFAGLAGPYDFLPLDTKVTRATFGAIADAPTTQPVTYASAGDPPVLLLTGARDDLVGPRNAVNLARALSDAGVPVEARSYRRLGHVGMVTAFARPFRSRGSVLGDVSAFAHRVTAR